MVEVVERDTIHAHDCYRQLFISYSNNEILCACQPLSEVSKCVAFSDENRRGIFFGAGRRKLRSSILHPKPPQRARAWDIIERDKPYRPAQVLFGGQPNSTPTSFLVISTVEF